jgi:hypothetical protein
VTIAVRRSDPLAAARIAAASRAALAHPLALDAELWVTACADDAIALGAFQRGVDAPPGALVRRGSGGPAVRLGPGTLHVALVLPRPDALVACDAPRLVNRYVRPLLRALTKVGHMAHYFGRDWVSVRHRPAAWIGFAHDASTGRSMVEAFVAVSTPFALDPSRASFLGKEPATLASLGDAVAMARLADAVIAAYAGAYGHAAVDAGPIPDGAPDEGDLRADPPWAATDEGPIGTIGAGRDGRGVLRVGGDLMASRDAIAALEAQAAGVAVEDLGRVVDAALGAPGVVVEGVASLASVRDVIARARGGQ